MAFHRLIKIKGEKNTGYFVPRMYHLAFSQWELKIFGLRLVKERLNGWDIWWVDNEDDYIRAVDTLNELRKTRIFDFKVSTPL